ncbi:MAG: FHA domain-containing protein [Rhodospirillaceae bacterium]|nr:FHA domain-containing protein [Rhodospirillaceae bacterium]
MAASIVRFAPCGRSGRIYRHIVRVVTLAILLLLPAFSAQALSRAEKTRISKAVVAVQVYEDGKVVARGAGFIAGRAGHVLASAAVLDAGDRVTVVTQGSQELAANVLLKDEESGLGVLKVDNLRLAGLLTFTKPVPAQTLIYAAPRRAPPAGAEFVRGTVIRGKTATVGDARIRFVQHSAIISPRGYGSPVVDECGRVLGLNVPDPGASGFWTAKRKLKPKGFVWALSVGEIAARLKRLGIAVSSTARACVPAQAREQAAARAAARRAKEAAALAAARAAEEQQRSTRMRQLAIWGGGAGIALLLAILLWWAASARRRRRSMQAAQAQAAEADQRAAMAQRRLDEMPEPAPFDCALTGRSEDGAHYALNLQRDILGNPAGVVVGRNPAGSAYVIADSSVSREHARFYIEDGALRVEDLESTNGTRLNGRQLKPGLAARVGDGDELVLGSVRFTVVLEP